MPEVRQTMLTPDPNDESPLGDRLQANLESAYPQSPIFLGDVSDEERKTLYQENCLDGTASGLGVNNFNRDYLGTSENPVPDIGGNTETVDGKAFGEGQGAPTTPYIPPLTSPGPNSVAAGDQPAFTGTTPDPESNVEFGSGLGGLSSPAESSVQISGQTLLSDYISGRSYEGSAG